MSLLPENRSSFWQAALFAIGASIGFASLWGLVRWGSETQHPFVLAMWRNVFGLLFLLPVVGRNAVAILHPRNLRRHFRRTAGSLVGLFCTFYAVANLPMPTALAISYTMPLFATLLAVLMLGERIRWRRIMTLIIGFCGMLLVVRPGGAEDGAALSVVALIAAVAAAMAIALVTVEVKALTRTDSSQAISLSSFVMLTPVSIALALPVLAPLSLRDWGIGVGLGISALVAQVLMSAAYRRAEASALMPFDFVRFVLVIALGVLGFDDGLDGWTLTGGAIILLSTLYLAHREAVVARERA